MWAAQSLSSGSAPVEVLTATGLIYVVVCYPLSLVVRNLCDAAICRVIMSPSMGLSALWDMCHCS
jgi:hypothetical protein